MIGPGLSDAEKAAVRWLVILVAALGLTGFVLSFEKVQRAVEPSFGSLAPLVPAGIDIGIAVFTGLDLLMARLNMRTRWLRLVPWALVGVTVYLNVSGEATLVGRVAHAAMPLLWVVAVEAGAHVVKVQAGLATADERMDRIRSSRWLLAPVSTVRLWRRMVLWEVRDYRTALSREQDRLLALCDLRDEHGPLVWRWKANRRDRVAYRLGQLAPARALPTGNEDETDGGPVRGGGQVLGPAPTAPPEPQPEPARPQIIAVPPQVPQAPEQLSQQEGAPSGNGDLLTAANTVAAELRSEGRPVSRRQMAARLRDRGYRLGTDKAQELVEAVT